MIRLHRYHNGNDTDAGQIQGFGHTGFLVDDLIGACNSMIDQGVNFKKKPEDGNMRGNLSRLWAQMISSVFIQNDSEIAFAYDPDGYWVEIIQRNGFRVTRNADSA